MTATASGTEDISENRIELGGGLRCVPVPPQKKYNHRQTSGFHLELSPMGPKSLDATFSYLIRPSSTSSSSFQPSPSVGFYPDKHS